MFERFTDNARRVVVLAQDAAREMGHGQIAPPHLLLGLRTGEGLASAAMIQAGVDDAALRQRISASIEATPANRELAKVPFSREAKKVLELSLREALQLGHNYIGTEHIFFGAEREARQRDRDLDGLLGTSSSEIHTRLMRLLRGASGIAPMRSPALQTAFDEARHRAGRAPITTGHVLAAMCADSHSQAARALADLGLTSDAIERALAAVPVSDTTDAGDTSESAVITVAGTSTTISDPDILAVLRELSPIEIRDRVSGAFRHSQPEDGPE